MLKRRVFPSAGLILVACAKLAAAQGRDASARPDAHVPVSVSSLRAAARTAPELTVEEGSWIRPKLLRTLARATGVLLAPTALETRDGVVTWALLADANVEPPRLASACDAVLRDDPRVRCVTDTVAWAGAERARVSLAWRVASQTTGAGITFVQPLRALARFGEGVCLLHAERTPRTLDLTVRARDAEAIGSMLAFVTVTPGLSDLILVREELRGHGIEAVLSWPLDRATGPGDLRDDPWPARCEGRSVVGQDVRPGTLPVLRERILGTVSQGVVLRAGRREWLLTAGDMVAGTTVQGVRETGVMLLPPRARRAVLVRFPPVRPLPTATGR
jgi:hypothetical protein